MLIGSPIVSDLGRKLHRGEMTLSRTSGVQQEIVKRPQDPWGRSLFVPPKRIFHSATQISLRSMARAVRTSNITTITASRTRRPAPIA